jgi:hypothetical protein
MLLDSITRIEQFMTNALLSSPLVPLGVNVIRLADVSDEEGILQMVNSMVVRYTDSSVNVVSRAPLAMERSLNFEVNIACQSYLSNSGHDFAVQLLAAAHETLINQVPCNTGLEVIEPFVMTSEQFTGLTDSTHYTYTQRWTLTIQDYYRGISLDPCVARGNCSKLFPANLTQRLLPGEFLAGGRIIAPVLPPPNQSIPYDKDYAGVELNESGDLVYKWDPEKVFMTAGEIANGEIVYTGGTDESGQFYIFNLKLPSPGGGMAFDRFFFGADTGKRILQLPSTLYRSPNQRVFLTRVSEPGEDILPTKKMPRNGYGYVIAGKTYIYKDPTDADAIAILVSGGDLFPTEEGTVLATGTESYYRIGSTPIGQAWIDTRDFKLLNPNEYLPQVDTEGPEISE